MNQKKIDAIAALFGDPNDKVTAADITSVARLQEHNRMRAEEIASAPAHPTRSDEEWAVYKAFLMDRAGDADWIGAYREALAALKEDRKDEFPVMLDLLFKRARIALYAQMEV